MFQRRLSWAAGSAMAIFSPKEGIPMITSFRKAALAGACALLLAPLHASATSVASSTRDFTFVFNTPLAPGVFVPLNNFGALSTPAFAHPGGRLVVSYTAKCSVESFGFTTGVDLRIILRNLATGALIVLPPTGALNDNFCSANGTFAFDGFQMNAVNAVAAVAAGNYTASVQARVTALGARGLLANSSIIVWR
jgi:hypothetical protein